MSDSKGFGAYSVAHSRYSTRTELHQGRKHLVVPVVMMVEGVHNGSHGPLLHSIEELGRYPAAWDGIPVVINHPEENGAHVSANSPQIVDSRVVGRVYHTHVSDGKLKAEVWLDMEKAGRISSTAMGYIRQGRPLDVSIGVFTDDEPTTGEWNGESYTAIARNHRPDHLALLPGSAGACSWDDGCGIRANQEGGDIDVELIKTMKELIQKGFSIITQETGYQELARTIQTKLDRLDTDVKAYFLQEVYDGYFVYEVRSKTDGGPVPELFKRDYQFNNDGTVEFAGEPVKVMRRVEYIQTDKEGSSMANNKAADSCCPEKVEMLLQSKHFEESDREWLETTDEDRLDKLLSLQKSVEEKAPVHDEGEGEGDPDKDAGNPQMNEEQAIQVLEERLSDPSRFMELLPREHREQMEYGMRLYQEHRNVLIERISRATSVYSDDDLNSMQTGELEKLAKAIKPSADYSGMAGGSDIQTDELLLPPGVTTTKDE